MRGSPLLRAFFAFLAILALGYPLRRLTSADKDTPEVAPTTSKAEAKEVKLQITFTTPPKSFLLKHLGKEVWSEPAGQAESERRLQLAFPKEGVELHFSAEFPEGAPLSAARLVLTDPDGDEHVKSCWGTGKIDEVVTFP